MAEFKALVVEKGGGGETRAAFRPFDDGELMDGTVTVRVTHSTVNYKDGLAVTGRGPVVRRWPMIPGIDFAGIVERSDDPDFEPGDAVILNGWGTGETHLGAYAARSRVPGAWLVPLPDGLSPADAMAIGTAGYTAMLSLLALERHGVAPEHGSAIVTGAAGGVGSVAVALLAGAGWEVLASTGRPQEADYLSDLGAAAIVDRAELAAPAKPLTRERWAAAIDSVGSTTLASVLAATRSDGAVAACGLAGGMDLPTSVAPFILRGVSLLGINSVFVPRARRIEAWSRLARDLPRDKLRAMTRTIPLDGVIDAAHDILDGKVRGRIVVEIG